MSNKEVTAIALEPELKTTLDRIAVVETEGNRSQLIRKLVREALVARGMLPSVEVRDEGR